jgi:hypothetical protein
MGPEYPKIDTLFDRDKSTFKVTNRVRRPEFALLRFESLSFTEKIDGTNIRISFGERGPVIGGRTDRANLNPALADAIAELLASGVESSVRNTMKEREISSVTVYGEGYGANIQNGNLYSETPKFIGFDVLVDNRYWLAPGDCAAFLEKAGIEQVPHIEFSSYDDMTARVNLGFNSALGEGTKPVEGVIAKPLYNLFDQRGRRVMWKLKTKDF